MFKNQFSSTETSSFNTLYRQLSFQKFFALELHKTSKNCKNCWAVFQAAINSAAIFNFFLVNDLVMYRGWHSLSTLLTWFCTVDATLFGHKGFGYVQRMTLFGRKWHGYVQWEDTLFGRKWHCYAQRMTLSQDVNDLVMYRGRHSLWT
jgi:hypothetical protein